MTTQRDRLDAGPVRARTFASAPKRAAAFLGAVDALAIGCVVLALASLVGVTGPLAGLVPHPDMGTSGLRPWLVLALLVVLALVFEEAARRPARLKLRLTAGIKRDMTSVWCVSAAVALPPSEGALLVGVVMTYTWFRQQRPAGELLHLKVFNAATAIVGCVAASVLFAVVAEVAMAAPVGLGRAAAILAATIGYTLVNRSLVTLGGLALGMRLRDLLGSRDDNVVELATLCLGGLVAAAVAYEPWSAVFVLAPMLALQRGSVVRQLEAAAITDAKTGLLNAVAWEQLAQRELDRARRESESVSVLLIDIDRFKLVNDRWGHLAGDKVLRGIGAAITAALREYDGVGRFGGEEFVVVLPASAERQALVIAERVRLKANQLTVASIVDHAGADVGDGAAMPPVTALAADRLSVSIGVAVSGVDGSELTDLLHAADQALYRAKWNGRNQVQLARRGDERPTTLLV